MSEDANDTAHRSSLPSWVTGKKLARARERVQLHYR
jgi:hypothetical protein